MSDCVYLREALSNKTENGNQVHTCALHGMCVQHAGSSKFPICSYCATRLEPEHPKFAELYKDTLHFTSRDGVATHAMRGMLQGGAAFLVCGGPSAKELPLELMHQRGIYSLAVNNMAGYFKPNAFVCSDPPSKFHNGIWQDPSVMKLIPSPKLRKKRGRLRKKVGDEFEPLSIDGSQISASDCPNVFGFSRRSWMAADDTFFTEGDAAWGNHNVGVEMTGEEKTVCTPLLGIRLLYYLGARTVYLVGMDFSMDPKAPSDGNYAFGQERDSGAISSNNSHFRVVNGMLCRMQENGIFDRFGLGLYNCHQMSGLRAFPYAPFELAIKHTLKDMPEEPYDLKSWYNK